MNKEAKLTEIFNEFYEITNSIIGVYFDSTLGFDLLLKRHKENQKESLKILEKIYPNDATIEHLDSKWFMYGNGDPNKNTTKIYHQTTQAEFKIRNSKKGRNYKFIGNMCLITLYQFWEDHFRPKIAKTLGKNDKDDIRSDIFGDIRLIRNSIIHHHSIAKHEIEKCKILKWFKEGDEIFIDQIKLIEILNYIKTFKFAVLDNSNKDKV